jgi:hypothetical protein
MMAGCNDRPGAGRHSHRRCGGFSNDYVNRRQSIRLRVTKKGRSSDSRRATGAFWGAGPTNQTPPGRFFEAATPHCPAGNGGLMTRSTLHRESDGGWAGRQAGPGGVFRRRTRPTNAPRPLLRSGHPPLPCGQWGVDDLFNPPCAAWGVGRPEAGPGGVFRGRARPTNAPRPLLRSGHPPLPCGQWGVDDPFNPPSRKRWGVGRPVGRTGGRFFSETTNKRPPAASGEAATPHCPAGNGGLDRGHMNRRSRSRPVRSV